jgi:hypothetical protein
MVRVAVVLCALGLWASPAAAQIMSLDERECTQRSRALNCRYAGTGYLSGVRGYPRDAIRGMQLLDRGCALGDGESCWRVGIELAAGTVVSRDLARAADAYRRGCVVRHAISCERAAEKYESLGNALEAVRHFERACDLGQGWACRALARKYDTGSGGVTMDKARAAIYAQRACAAAVTDLQRSSLCGTTATAMGTASAPASAPAAPTMTPEEALELCKTGDLERCHLMGLKAVHARDYGPASARFEAACARKHGRSCDRLARMYMLGEGRDRDQTKAAPYFEQACEAGYLSGCSSRGRIVFEVEEKWHHSDASARWYAKGCAGGDIFGCSYLAGSFESGRLSKAFDAEVKALLEKSCRRSGSYTEQAPCRALDARAAKLASVDKCKKGEVAACLLAGQTLRAGEGLPKDAKAALEVLTIGCNDLRDGASCAELAVLHRTGELGRPDPKVALLHVQKALELAQPRCNAGELEACATVGRLVLAGEGAKRDPKRARDLFLKPCQKGKYCPELYRAYLLSSADPAADPAVEAALEESCQRGQGGIECGAKQQRADLGEHAAKCARGQLDACLAQAQAYRSAGLASMALVIYEKGCGKGVIAACGSLVELYGGYGGGGESVANPDKQKRPLAMVVGACEKNDSAACLIESELRRWGRGVPRDDAAAARLRGRATALLDEDCGRGKGAACRQAALAHRLGHGTTKSEERARELFERGCELKDPESCSSAGGSYLKGTGGMPADPKKASTLFVTACGLGQVYACTQLRVLATKEGLDADAQKGAADAADAACKRGIEAACPPKPEPPKSESAPEAQPETAPPPVGDGGA